MRIPEWTAQRHPLPQDLVDAVLARRGGTLINLDKALMWSEPVARGWAHYVGNVRSKLPTSWKLRELGICTVALLTGARYEYHHHAPDFLKAGGTQVELEALNGLVAHDPSVSAVHDGLGAVEQAVVQYAAQMTRRIEVDDAVYAAVAQHLNTTEILELTVAIATYNMVARILVALKINPEDH